MRSAHNSIISALVLVVIAASCAGGSGGTANGPEVTLGTVPDPEATADPDPEIDDANTPESSPTPTDAAESEAAPTNVSSTTALTPSPEADLPTEATPTGSATTLPGPLREPAVRLIEIGAFIQPVEATSADSDTRLFVVLRGGTVVALDDESNQVVFDIADATDATFTSNAGEQGLLGLAFHPTLDVAYVNFTDAEGHTVIAEFEHDPLTYEFDHTSFREVLTVDQPFDNHNGGEIVFGPDDFLYIGTGDGGSANDPNRDALDVSSRLGKILRIDPVATDAGPFTVPDDNPFVGVEGADPAIWSLGLRNPWKFSFDSLTGDLWIGDVGQNLWEEVDLAPATDGVNAGKGISFGWSAFEADDRFNEDQPSDGHTLPVTSYSHEDGNCSISGGVVARNSSYADLNGWYVYGDFCSGRLWALDTTSVASTPNGPVGEPTIVEIASVPGLSAVVEGPFGDIYALSANAFVYRLAPA
jgi:glucose/arabinose dehydrogenase